MGGLMKRETEPMRQPNRLVPLWGALGATFTAAIAVACVTLWAGLDLLEVHGVKHETQVSSSVLFDLVKLSFAVVAGLGGLVALVVAYRKQRTEENAALREDTKLHSDRFTAAVAQLGAASPAVQLGGVHALAGLADDAPTHALRQTCIDVLCAFLRIPYDPDPGKHPTQGQDPIKHAEAHKAYLTLREVRHTVIRTIGDHLRRGAEVSWNGHHFDFTGVVFDGGDLHGITIDNSALTFRHARFASGVVSFHGGLMRRGEVNFYGAKFEDGDVSFQGMEFEGGAVSFQEAVFKGCAVNFQDALFEGGIVSFHSAMFTKGALGFMGAAFTGGEVNFLQALFMGGVVHLDAARFEGSKVRFQRARFDGARVSLQHAKFLSGDVDFLNVTFAEGEVDFQNAEFLGSAVSFQGACGFRPNGLPTDLADHLPTAPSPSII
ncbi:pentapeptide repeat-containing protein [Actinomadura oligospora]|uniref:pentapeptide repeat-containing protein n=1 Tax=Actinomadura oligospora TaxID=111804 RepID=UPI000685F732|nr:pentapeptide repeat-containing protein [Actinomadura oligospora]